MTLQVSEVKFVPATPGAREGGLLGFLSFLVGGSLRIDGVTLRRTMDGRTALSFPARRDRAGRAHYVVCPIDDASRLAIEQQVFESLQAGGESPGGDQR